MIIIYILLGVSILLGLYAIWASRQNTKAIAAIMHVIEEYEQILMTFIKKT